MAEGNLDIGSLVESIVVPLVENPEDVVVNARMEDDGTYMVEVSVNPDDAGKVIGRQGRVIKSIRTLARAAASRVDAHAEVEILD